MFVGSRGRSSDRGIPLTYAVLFVPKVSQYPPMGVESKLKTGMGISCLLLVRRFDGGELLLSVCETLGEGGLVLCLLGLLVVDASVLEGAEVAATLEPDGGYKALDFGAASEHKRDTQSSVPHGVNELRGGYWTYALVYGFAASFFLLVTSRRMTNLRTSSSFLRLKNLRTLVARLGPSRLRRTVSVRPGISCSPCLTTTRERTAMSGPTMHPRTDLRLRSPVRRGRKHE